MWPRLLCRHMCVQIYCTSEIWNVNVSQVRKSFLLHQKEMSGNFEKHHFFVMFDTREHSYWANPTDLHIVQGRFCFQCHSSNSRLVALKVWQQVVIKTYHFIGTKYERSFFSDMLMNSPFEENQNCKTSFLGMLHLLFLLLSCLFFWDKQ